MTERDKKETLRAVRDTLGEIRALSTEISLAHQRAQERLSSLVKRLMLVVESTKFDLDADDHDPWGGPVISYPPEGV